MILVLRWKGEGGVDYDDDDDDDGILPTLITIYPLLLQLLVLLHFTSLTYWFNGYFLLPTLPPLSLLTTPTTITIILGILDGEVVGYSCAAKKHLAFSLERFVASKQRRMNQQAVLMEVNVDGLGENQEDILVYLVRRGEEPPPPPPPPPVLVLTKLATTAPINNY